MIGSAENGKQALELATKISPIIKKIQLDKESDSNNQLIQNAKNFVHAHYHEPITLKLVAEEIGVHPNYLSNLFSKLTEETFLSYVIRVRIEKSKELLQNPQLKIYEISEFVGYNDYRWFSKLFKQYESITPQQYRDNFLSS